MSNKTQVAPADRRVWTQFVCEKAEQAVTVLNQFPNRILSWQIYHNVELRRPVIIIEHTLEKRPEGQGDPITA